MAVEILIPISLFLCIFGILYMYYTTRNKERMALIEKGGDASIFFGDKNGNIATSRKMFILNSALVLIGVGMAFFIGAFLESMGVEEDVAYPGSIFLMAGLGLLIGFFVNSKMLKEK